VWLGTPVLLWLVNGDVLHASPALTVIGTFLGGAVASVAGVTLRPIIMNVNEPETRGMALSLQATLDDIGKGLGPALVASLISWLGRAAAFNVAVCGWFPCGLLISCAGITLARDEDAMQSRLSTAVMRRGGDTVPEPSGGLQLVAVRHDSFFNLDDAPLEPQ